jgi:site-specific DNA-methyltransferase (adenine-specific)
MIDLQKGDCLELIKDIKDRSIDLILFDPPYSTTNAKWDNTLDWDKVWVELKRVRKEGCPILIFSQIPFTIQLGMTNLKELRYEIIWEKTQGTGFLNANRTPIKCHENILMFYDKLGVYNPQKTQGHERKVSTAKHKRNCEKGEAYNEFYDTDYDSTERFPRDVIKFKSDKQHLPLHSTQKPLGLCEWLIKTYSNEGDTVLDITCGASTTLIAAEKCNRNSIGFEMEDYFYQLSKMRIDEKWDDKYPDRKYLKEVKEKLKEQTKY